eukprot:62956-Chlamydomonas_euryale.AAC.3
MRNAQTEARAKNGETLWGALRRVELAVALHCLTVARGQMGQGPCPVPSDGTLSLIQDTTQTKTSCRMWRRRLRKSVYDITAVESRGGHSHGSRTDSAWATNPAALWYLQRCVCVRERGGGRGTRRFDLFGGKHGRIDRQSDSKMQDGSQRTAKHRITALQTGQQHAPCRACPPCAALWDSTMPGWPATGLPPGPASGFGSSCAIAEKRSDTCAAVFALVSKK